MSVHRRGGIAGHKLGSGTRSEHISSAVLLAWLLPLSLYLIKVHACENPMGSFHLAACTHNGALGRGGGACGPEQIVRPAFSFAESC